MERSNRITYRFNSLGEKIDEHKVDLASAPNRGRLDQPERIIESGKLVKQEIKKAELTEQKRSEAVEQTERVDEVERLQELEQLELLIRNAEYSNLEYSNLEYSSPEYSNEEQSDAMNENNDSEFGHTSKLDGTTELLTEKAGAKDEQRMNWDGAVYGDRIIREPLAVDQNSAHIGQSTNFTELEFGDGAYSRKQSVQRFTWMQGALSVLSAIISGGLIGYLLLTLVFGISVWPLSGFTQPEDQKLAAAIPTVTDQFNTAGADNEAEGQDAEGAAGQSEQPPVAGISIEAKSFQYYVLQAGVFSQQKTRDETIASLQQAGFPAHYILDNDNRYFVYAGAASTAENANAIKSKIKGIETYRKEMTITTPSSMAFNGEAQLLESFVQSSNDLIAMYADLIAVQLEQTSLSAIGDAAKASAKDNATGWLQLADETEELWVNDRDLEYATALKEQLIVAQQQLESYQKQPRSSYLWNAQAALVKSILLQKDWYESVNSLS